MHEWELPGGDMDADLDERRRLEALDALNVFGTPAETRFDYLTMMAAEYFQVPMAAIGMVGAEHIWMKSQVGLPATRWLREGTFTDTALRAPGMLVIEDAFDHHDLATSDSTTGQLAVRFYAAQHLVAPDGHVVGVFFIADTRPRAFSVRERQRLESIASFLSDELARDTDAQRAVEVAQALAPKAELRIEGYEVAGTSIPAQVVGGDVYDWYYADNNLRLTVADVMGKGVAAAILAAGLRACVRQASRAHGARSAMARTAETLADDFSAAGAFATLFHGQLHAPSGVLTYVDAGHGLTLHIHADGTFSRLNSAHLPLGIDTSDKWSDATVRLEAGESLVIFSDGILDFFDDEDTTYAYLTTLMGRHQSAQLFVDALIKLTPHDQPDDCTVITVRRN